MGQDQVITRRVGDVLEISLNRPYRLNALSTDFASDLSAALGRAAEDTASVVALTSSVPSAFCVGADLKSRVRISDDEMLEQRATFRSMFDAIFAIPQPIVVGVHGWALGGGCEVALASDVILAAENAVFALPEVSRGVIPAGGGTVTAARRVGLGRASELIFSCRRVRALEAVQIGLADRYVAGNDARPEALRLAQEIAENSPDALRASKKAVRRGASVALDAALDIEDSAWRSVAFGPDRHEGVAAFVEGRAPEWPSRVHRQA